MEVPHQSWHYLGWHLQEKKYPSTSNVTKRKSLTWNNILKAKSICDEGSHWIIGNGKTTHFWYDNWTGHGPLRNLIQSPLHILDTIMKVKDCWDAKWNLNASSFALPDQVHCIIRATPKPLLSSLSDLPTWNLSPNRQFNPRMTYILAANLPLTHNATTWNWLWKSHTLLRVKTVLWLACHDRLHTKNQLLKRHVINDDSCPLCLSYSETTTYSQGLPKHLSHMAWPFKYFTPTRFFLSQPHRVAKAHVHLFVGHPISAEHSLVHNPPSCCVVHMVSP